MPCNCLARPHRESRGICSKVHALFPDLQGQPYAYSDLYLLYDYRWQPTQSTSPPKTTQAHNGILAASEEGTAVRWSQTPVQSSQSKAVSRDKMAFISIPNELFLKTVTQSHLMMGGRGSEFSHILCIVIKGGFWLISKAGGQSNGLDFFHCPLLDRSSKVGQVFSFKGSQVLAGFNTERGGPRHGLLWALKFTQN